MLILPTYGSAQTASSPMTNALATLPPVSGSPSQPIHDLLARVTQQVNTNTDPKSFDGLLVELAQAADRTRAGSFDRTSFLEIDAAERFVKEWQGYLVDLPSASPQQAASDLHNLANNNSEFMPIPRSELLARAVKATQNPTANVMVQIEIKSFDDLPEAISRIELTQRTGGFTNELNLAMNAIQLLEGAYQAFLSHNYVMALQQLQNQPIGGMQFGAFYAVAGSGGKGDSLGDQLARLKNTLVIEVVQALLAMPDMPASEANEQGSDYLLRLAGAAEKAGAWENLQKILQVYSQLSSFNLPPWLAEDVSGLRSYLIGEKLEAAGQTLDAIRSYRQALATLGRFFPAEPATTKLKMMEKKYPELYQQALQLPIVPKGPWG